MELFNIINNKFNQSKLILMVSGNSRFQILYDYEIGLIDKEHICFSNGKLYLEVSDINNILDENYDKHYMQFKYSHTIPTIINKWAYNQYTPINNAEHLHQLKDSTYSDFNILNRFVIDINEIVKNDNIFANGVNELTSETECFETMFINECSTTSSTNVKFKSSKVSVELKTYPNIINKYGNFLNLKKDNRIT